MILDTIQFFIDGLEGIISSFLVRDYVFYIGIGFTLLMVLFFFIKSSLSYECKLERSVNRINEWLHKHQTITEGNLIEFNSLLKDKRTPKILRKHWQQYMLYRDKLPSEYMSAYNCIDKPAKTSSFSANIKNFISIYRVTAFVTLFFSLAIHMDKSSGNVVPILCYSLITPVIVLLLGVIFTLILRSMQNNNLASLYQTFYIFNRYIDKASATIPKYVDFEILFTKKEIKNGIPILGEYLEKRARQEQEELEEAQRNAVSHEEYDFSNSGVDGSLVLERAMKESETYLNAKQRTLAEIQQFESEISTLKKNYENTSKEYQRKLQTSKENMERLRQQQEESTNRIEVNYIRKQQQDEVKKQEQLEHDQEDATNKFNTEINSLTEEIEKRRADIEEKRQRVQNAMENEYQTFSAKLHKAIADDVEKVSSEAISKISIEKDQYAQAITYLKNESDNKDQIIKAKDQIIEELQNRISSMMAGVNTQQLEADESEFIEDEMPQEEVYEGIVSDEQIIDETNVDEVFDNNQDNFEEPQEGEDERYAEEVDEQTVEDELAEESMEGEDEQEQGDEEPQDVVEEESAEGHYDERGYYWFNDKTYYDADGLYHDLEGNVYDSEGNLLESGQEVEVEQVAESENVDSNEQVEEIEQSEISDDIDSLNIEEEKEEMSLENIANEALTEVRVAEVSLGESEEEQQSENDESVEQEAPKRKVGRPRKEKATEEAPKEKRKVGRPKKETSANVEEAPKRKVGRPKKEVTITEEPKEKRKVGRPKKEVETTNEQPKRKVGRPKKEETSEPKEKRSVGRPRKEKAEEDAPKEKRKVGRPKKSQNESHLDILKHIGQSLIDATEKEDAKPKRKASKK